MSEHIEIDTMTEEEDPFINIKLSKDLLDAAKTLDRREARYLVGLYYQKQEDRKRTAGQIRALTENEEPCGAIGWFNNLDSRMEEQLKGALGKYALGDSLGRWSLEQKGIGPVMSAGLLAHIDIKQAPVVSHIWRYAGLDPTIKWLSAVESEKIAKKYGILRTDKKVSAQKITEVASILKSREELFIKKIKNSKGNITGASFIDGMAKRPWNEALKTLCWKIGESFVKVSGKEEAYYGKLYLKRKDYEVAKNTAGVYSDQAASRMNHVGKTTEAYSWYAGCYPAQVLNNYYDLSRDDQVKLCKTLRGDPGSGIAMLSPGHIYSRAKRWAVKIFLAHWHEQAYREKLGMEPPLPYAIAYLDHAHHLKVPA